MSGGGIPSDQVREDPDGHVRPVPRPEHSLDRARAAARPDYRDGLITLRPLTSAVILKPLRFIVDTSIP